MIPLNVYGQVTAANGTTYRWDANQPSHSRPLGLRFSTKTGDGFSDGSLQLARRIDKDYPDLELGNAVTFTAADGTPVFEGFISAMPRELSDRHSIGVTLTGWMAHAKDVKFREVYVGRGQDGWGGMSLARKAAALVANYVPYDGEQVVDPTDQSAGIATAFNGTWASPYKPLSEAWYDAGPGVTIAKVGYSWRRESAFVIDTDPDWSWGIGVASDDKATVSLGTANLRAAGPATLQTFTPATPYRYVFLQHVYNGTPAGADGARYAIDWSKLALYGAHGLTLRQGDPDEPLGVTASDVMKNIAARWCPLLDTSGVRDTSYVIQNLAYRDRTYPYDAFLDLNKYHLRHLGVWDNRTLHFRPYDMSDYDWEIRTDDPGTTFSPQGPSTESLFNGIAVEYTDLSTGTTKELTPADTPALADLSVENPWNLQGRPRWDDLSLSTPELERDAAAIGAAVLAERNRPSEPGTITVQGYIRDRAGNLQPVSKVRAGERIAITNFANDRPRLIRETDYDDDSKGLRIAVDNTFQTMEALFDRTQNALSARGLS
jgi:hypothetical protein